MMEVLATLAVIPPCLGLALLLQFGALKIILWALHLKMDSSAAQTRT
jgi:hypothetical protein